MTWHICSPQLDMDFFLCRQLYHYKRYQYQSLDCWTWWIWQEAVHCDGSGMNNCFLPDTHHIQHSTAQQQLLIWNWSSQSLVMQNVKNVRRRIDKRRKVNLKLLCNNRTEVCLKNSMKTLGSGTDWSPQQQTQIYKRTTKRFLVSKTQKENGCGYFGVRSSTLKRKAKRETE